MFQAPRTTAQDGAAQGTSMAALLVSVLSGAMHRYCRAHDPAMFEPAGGADRRARAMLPVPIKSAPRSAERWAEGDDSLCNSFAVVSVDLPLWEESPLERLASAQLSLARSQAPVMAAVSGWQSEHLLAAMPLGARQKETLGYVVRAPARICCDY